MLFCGHPTHSAVSGLQSLDAHTFACVPCTLPVAQQPDPQSLLTLQPHHH
jgi:hypothetical protein